ncbi:MAG: ATP-binding protein [Oscillospiraceae bacterium]|nr:ATP-binding protein [Oscillospiraceae bacterium]
MDCYENNSQCILDYLALFQALSAEEVDAVQCQKKWHTILAREQASGGIQLAAPLLRRQLQLEERDFLLTMAALALEMDGGLRNAFRRKYALSLPTIEYGLQLISPLCPSGCETLAELAEGNLLCGLVLTAAGQTAYLLERPLVLCRTILAFLTGLSMAEIPGCKPLMEADALWLPVFEEELAQVQEWYAQGTENTLYLCAPAGSGRKTLLRRACGNVIHANIEELSDRSLLDQDHALREMAALATLLAAPICAAPDSERKIFRPLERLCRQYGIPLSALVEEDTALAGAKEVVRLPRQLSAGQRRMVWDAVILQAAPDSVPKGAMTIGAVLETALLAKRLAIANGQASVAAENTRQAMLHRGGALEFGVRYQADVSLEDMVLPDGVRKQLELICQAALNADKLAAWGLPRQREGVTAVFHGPSGTGKTMAASAIAHRLGMPLLRADLSQIMDKYVGETEKHLGRLFRSARENHCVLLFDEADSLFGKRAKVSSGHDKYANLSTSYLLQEIEQYDGIAILSTNLLGSFDDAFLRRLQYIVRFNLPDAALRETLWRQALPPERSEEELPYAQLAQTELSPARIFAVARGAVVRALGAGQDKVDITSVINALGFELEKSNRSLPKPFCGAFV